MTHWSKSVIKDYGSAFAALQAFEPEVGLILQLSAETFHEKFFPNAAFCA